jgi:outer membrane protein assembly factor BamD
MKYLFLVLIFAAGFWGCSSSYDTTSMDPEQRYHFALKLFNNRNYEDALKEFQAIILQYPGSSISDSSQYYLGQTRFQRDEYIMAAYEYSRLIKNMPASKLVPESQYMLAECYYRLSPDYSLDQKYTKKAIEELQAFIDFFPTDTKVPEAEKKIAEMNEKLAHKEYYTAYIYTKLEYYNAALICYDNVTDNYHDTHYAPLALFDKINLLVSRKRNDEALTSISKFMEKYPTDSHIQEVEKIKTTLEDKLSTVNNEKR